MWTGINTLAEDYDALQLLSDSVAKIKQLIRSFGLARIISEYELKALAKETAGTGHLQENAQAAYKMLEMILTD